MLRIRNANRLMSEAAEPFRNKMTELIRSYNDPSRLANVSNQDI